MKPIDEYSFNLGKHVGEIKAWCEAAKNGAKKMSLSNPFKPEEIEEITTYIKEYTTKNQVQYYLEKELLVTELFGNMALLGIWVYLIYRDTEVLNEYLSLKEEKKQLEKDGAYTGNPRRDLAVRFGRLLGYSDEAIYARWS